MKESRPHVLAFYHQASAKAEALSEELQLNARGHFKVSQVTSMFRQLDEQLVSLAPEQPVIVLADLDALEWTEGFAGMISVPEPGKIQVGASALFDFQDQELQYFYWKHYPRNDGWYNYPDASVMIGRAGDLKALLDAFSVAYPENRTLQHLIVRYYADSQNHHTNAPGVDAPGVDAPGVDAPGVDAPGVDAPGVYAPGVGAPVQVMLDRQQQMVASTVYSSRKKLSASWMFGFLYMRNEDRSSGHLLNVQKDGGRFIHLRTGERPALVSTSIKAPTPKRRPTWWFTLRDWLYIGRINKWHFDTRKLFRYRPNGSKQLDQGTRAIVNRLERKQPLSFAHYNDGELTFIRDFLKGETHEKWFGRKQQKYDPILAKRLHEAMTFKKEGYFVGVPCSTDHPMLRELADDLVGTYDYKVQAMVLHHNLAYMPRILSALRGRECYFFTNEYQDLSLFRNLGITVKEERITSVPFKNSYLEYDRYKDMHFPEHSVVVLTCGMLAKILTKVWYERHDNLTVLALGSSLDDHIQKRNINFELYPKDTPLTRNIKFSRSFLFGYKKPCKECYDF